jgi:hypothetical protein
VVPLGVIVGVFLLAVPQPPLALSMMQAVGTIALYPAVVAASHLFLGLRRPAASDPGGARLGS